MCAVCVLSVVQQEGGSAGGVGSPQDQDHSHQQERQEPRERSEEQWTHEKY